MKLIYLSLSSVCLGLFSCSSQPPVAQTEYERLYSVHDPQKGHYSSKATVGHIRSTSNIKEYAINAYVDPNNPNVRMPGGAMHVITRPSRWNTQPLTQHGIVVEPQYATIENNVPHQIQNGKIATLQAEVKRLKQLNMGAALENRQMSKNNQEKIDTLKFQIDQLQKKE